MKTGVLGDLPLTRRHVYTKCVSCDGRWEPFSSAYRIIVLLLALDDVPQCWVQTATACA